MSLLKKSTFPVGGIHPEDHKITSGSPLQTLPVPGTVTIPLSQHVGAPAKALVAKGDKVKVGTLIGEAQGFVSANIHSSVSGTVTKVEDALLVNGYKAPAVTIQVEGDDWEPAILRSPETAMPDPAEILARLKAAGIVGLGGATFPAHVKLALPPGKKADTLILDGAECEPWLTADHRLMMEEPIAVLTGADLMARVLGVQRVIIAVEENKKDAAEVLSHSLAGFPGTEVRLLKVKYPQGGEKQLIKAVLNREVPSGKLPLDVGCVVNNVGTSFAVYQAVMLRRPLIDRVVTVTGPEVPRPGNFRVRIGTPAAGLLEAAGVKADQIGKLINGGPMMGRAASHLDFAVTKGTSGLVVFPPALARRREIEPCIRCGKCVDVCPMALQPYLLEKLGERHKYDEAEGERILDCMECGCCSWVCPSNRPILDYIRSAKSTILRLKRERSAR